MQARTRPKRVLGEAGRPDNAMSRRSAVGPASHPNLTHRRTHLMEDRAAERLARRFHELYEELAPAFGYETRDESRKVWDEVPEKNRELMTAVCASILDEGLLVESLSNVLVDSLSDADIMRLAQRLHGLLGASDLPPSPPSVPIELHVVRVFAPSTDGMDDVILSESLVQFQGGGGSFTDLRLGGTVPGQLVSAIRIDPATVSPT